MRSRQGFVPLLSGQSEHSNPSPGHYAKMHSAARSPPPEGNTVDLSILAAAYSARMAVHTAPILLTVDADGVGQACLAAARGDTLALVNLAPFDNKFTCPNTKLLQAQSVVHWAASHGCVHSRSCSGQQHTHAAACGHADTSMWSICC